jgi:hypothetical protein
MKPISTDGELAEHSRMLESDLDSLFKLVFTYRKPLAEGDIRLASVILRKWLTDGLLGHYCHVGGVSPTLEALDTIEICDAVAAHPHVNYFLAAGIMANGRPIESIYNATIPYPGKPLISIKMKRREFQLQDFLRQKRMYFEGDFYTCEDIIKYVANKLGGAHLDFSREKFQGIERAAAYMTYGGRLPDPANPPSPMYIILEPESKEILSGAHVEIIAAAASLVNLRLNGKPILVLTKHPSLRTRLRRKLGLTESSGYRILVPEIRRQVPDSR